MNFNISTRIVLGYCIAIVFAAAIGVTGIYQLNKVSTGADHMYQYNTIPLPKLGMSFAHFQRIRVNLRDVLLHQGNAEMHKELIARIGEMKKDIKEEIEEFDKASQSEDIKKESAILHSELESFYKIGDTILGFVAKGDYAGALKEMDANCFKSAKGIEEAVNKLNAMKIKQAKETSEANHSAFKTGMFTSIAMIVISAIICILFAILIVRSITQPMKKMTEMIKDIAQGEGDLTKRLDDSGKDEIAEVCRWFNTFVGKLHGIIGKISDTTNQVASASAQLHTTSEQMAAGAEQAVAQCSTVATAAEEMSATSGNIAQNCQSAADGSQQASGAAVNGAQVVDETIKVMKNITDKVTQSAKAVESLGERSDQIGAIVGTIEDIADQTNLLALNAAIEAARAGEQGRGFAVVADEVRALAERTTKATKEISDMIKAIQKETKSTVTAMEEGVAEVKTGGEKAAESGKALESIQDQVNAVTAQIHQVATAAEEQTATTTEISGNMQQITSVIGQTSRGAQESASAANQLSSLADDLRKIVGQFKL